MRERGINLCESCHKFIHKKFSEKELGRDYNTLNALIENPIILFFLANDSYPKVLSIKAVYSALSVYL